MADLVQRYGAADTRDKVEAAQEFVEYLAAGHDFQEDEIAPLLSHVSKDLTSMNYKVQP